VTIDTMTRTRRAGHGRPPVERRPSAPPRAAAPLVAGPRWYRQRVRRFGWLAGLVPMALIGLAAWAALAAGDGRPSGMFGLVAGVSAAPGLLLAGAPFGDTGEYTVAVFASIPLWLGLGGLASRRATVSPVAAWGDYARELLWLTIAVVAGACIALVAATLWLGESLVA
jgi:hypothetical protein